MDARTQCMRRGLTRVAAGLLIAAVGMTNAFGTHAQDFPMKSKPIKVIVSFPPGAAPDSMARPAVSANGSAPIRQA
jgi:tripartite-type tricarboxylate transporter receptor subunit TctC